MTRDEAKTLKRGDLIWVAAQADKYRVVETDEDGDVVVENPHGGPTNMCFLHEYCHKVEEAS